MNSAIRAALGIGNIEIEALQDTVLKRYMIDLSQLHSSQKVDFRKGDRISVIKHSILDNHVSFETDDLARMGKWYAFRPHVKIHGEVVKIDNKATELISLEQLKAIAIHTKASVLAPFIPHLNTTMARYQINTPLRIAHFLAQIAHESDGFHTTREYADGSAYEGRSDLGNTQKGDGVRFRGRALIQLTGRNWYKIFGDEIGQDLISNPDLLEGMELACLASGWFWNRHSLNSLADADNFDRIMRIINGSNNGEADRWAYLARAKRVLKL